MNFDPITRDYDGSAHKALSDNRAAYIAQSAASRHGEVAEFKHTSPATCLLGCAASLTGSQQSPQPPDRSPSLPPREVGDAGDFHPDPPTPEEVAAAAAFKYGAL